MTEEEAEVIRVRLNRIWTGEGEELTFRAEDLSFNGHLRGALCFTCWCDGDTAHQAPYTIDISPWEGEGLGTLQYSHGAIYDSYKNTLVDEAFVTRWLPFFRRGCWLSGCSIEATAHEKAEWIRDFTREEIEAWKLKM